MIIVTRPSPEGSELTQLLNQADLPAKHLPLFAIQAGTDLSILQDELNQLQPADVVIIVSPQITHMIHAYLPTLSFPHDVRYFAVGQKSAELFSQLSTRPTRYPAQEDSEGLLQLLESENLEDKTVLILRGNIGRQLLGDTLTNQKANVKFLACYHRKPIHYPATILADHIDEQIIIVTSVEHLLQLESFCSINHKYQAQLVVTSERIIEKAKQRGWQKIMLTQGANNQILFKTMATLCHNAKITFKDTE